MWQVLLGFSAGVYVGTYYDCRPFLDTIGVWMRDHCPPPKKK